MKEIKVTEPMLVCTGDDTKYVVTPLHKKPPFFEDRFRVTRPDCPGWKQEGEMLCMEIGQPLRFGMLYINVTPVLDVRYIEPHH